MSIGYKENPFIEIFGTIVKYQNTNKIIRVGKKEFKGSEYIELEGSNNGKTTGHVSLSLKNDCDEVKQLIEILSDFLRNEGLIDTENLPHEYSNNPVEDPF